MLLALVLSGCDSAGDGGSSGAPLEQVENITVYETPPAWDFSVAEDGDIWTNNRLGVAF